MALWYFGIMITFKNIYVDLKRFLWFLFDQISSLAKGSSFFVIREILKFIQKDYESTNICQDR